MLNEPPEERPRKLHPLERPPQQPPDTNENDENAPRRQQVMLHIPFVRPHITFALIGINVLIFILGIISPQLNAELMANGANNHYSVLVAGEYLRLVTAMFLHAGIAHIFFNMYALMFVGSTVEGLFGHARFAIIYFFGGLTGSIASVVFNNAFIYSVGASGAVFALFGAELIYLYQHRKLLGASGRQRLQSVIMVSVMNLAIGLLSAASPGGIRIDNWGHIGGFFGGIVLTWYIGPLLLPKAHPEREGALTVDDVNPLRNRYQTVSLFIAAQLAVLIAATLWARQ